MRKGEHSQIVVFWKVDQIPNTDSDGDSKELEADEKTRRRFVLRYYWLFILEQCELTQTVLDKLPRSKPISKRMVVTAAAQAQKAADYILNRRTVDM